MSNSLLLMRPAHGQKRRDEIWPSRRVALPSAQVAAASLRQLKLSVSGATLARFKSNICPPLPTARPIESAMGAQ